MRVYATREDTGKRVLVAIQCDGCGAEIKPNAGIQHSGWTKTGVYYGPGSDRNAENCWCPNCTRQNELF